MSSRPFCNPAKPAEVTPKPADSLAIFFGLGILALGICLWRLMNYGHVRRDVS